MPRSKNVSAYDPIMLDALSEAFAHGEFRIPSSNPAALRLDFYGLCGALRHEGKPELCAGLKFYLGPGSVIIKANNVNEVYAALNRTPADETGAEEFLKRLGV